MPNNFGIKVGPRKAPHPPPKLWKSPGSCPWHPGNASKVCTSCEAAGGGNKSLKEKNEGITKAAEEMQSEHEKKTKELEKQFDNFVATHGINHRSIVSNENRLQEVDTLQSICFCCLLPRDKWCQHHGYGEVHSAFWEDLYGVHARQAGASAGYFCWNLWQKSCLHIHIRILERMGTYLNVGL